MNCLLLVEKLIPKHRNSRVGYVIAVIIVLLALGLRLLIAPIEAGIPFLTFFPAVTLVVVYGGLAPALFTLVASSLIASYLFIPPFHAFTFTFQSQAVWENIIFALEALMVISVTEALYRNRSNYIKTNALVEQLNLAQQELLISAAAFETQESIMITDDKGLIIKVNKAFSQITGYSAEEAIGQTPRLLKSGLHDVKFYQSMWQSINNTGVWQGEIWDKHKNGSLVLKWMTITAIKNNQGLTSHFVATQLDITAYKAAEEKINYLAFYDPLTQLANRQLLLSRLDIALKNQKQTKQTGALIFIDFDQFKILNDTRGHDIGDLFLQEVARRLISCVPLKSTIARLGGDDFMVLLPELDPNFTLANSQVLEVTDSIDKALSRDFNLIGKEYNASASMGVTLFSDHAVNLDELLKQADIALYQAKKSGRNSPCFFSPEMQDNINSFAALEYDLRKAIQNKQFELYYQVQFNNAHQPLGAEVLIRWHHPQRGMVSPGQFIPIAESSSLILELGNWVLETACQQLAVWQQDEDLKTLVIAVNVSAVQFREPSFLESVKTALETYQVKPWRLKLELTESVIVDELDDVISKMHALKTLGIHLSLDDFGTGYSSLTYLKKLPLDQIKIDQSFVRDIISDPNDAVMVKTIIEMAKNFNLHVIAEGVETIDQLNFLKQNGCLAYQGYLFSKPLPIKEFETLLNNLKTSTIRSEYG